MKNLQVDATQNLNPLTKTVVGVQFLFVAFGATVLVPILAGLDPATALFSAGIGTLILPKVGTERNIDRIHWSCVGLLCCLRLNQMEGHRIP